MSQNDVNGEQSQPGFRESFAEALRRTGFGRVAPGEVPTGSSLLKAVGGVRGIIESIVPGLGFLVVYTVTHALLLSVLAPLALSVIFIVARLIMRSPVIPALAGIVLLAVSAILALVTGRADNNFVPGMIINAVCILALLVSIVVRWPLIGVIVGFLTNEPSAWRDDRSKRRVLYIATWLWVLLFGIRLIVELREMAGLSSKEIEAV
ncbi:MAG: DUF3159 domain-containing protein, partial [Actinomycetota bacterium]